MGIVSLVQSSLGKIRLIHNPLNAHNKINNNSIIALNKALRRPALNTTDNTVSDRIAGTAVIITWSIVLAKNISLIFTGKDLIKHKFFASRETDTDVILLVEATKHITRVHIDGI